jgi:hypothetical protein
MGHRNPSVAFDGSSTESAIEFCLESIPDPRQRLHCGDIARCFQERGDSEYMTAEINVMGEPSRKAVTYAQALAFTPSSWYGKLTSDRTAQSEPGRGGLGLDARNSEISFSV